MIMKHHSFTSQWKGVLVFGLNVSFCNWQNDIKLTNYFDTFFHFHFQFPQNVNKTNRMHGKIIPSLRIHTSVSDGGISGECVVAAHCCEEKRGVTLISQSLIPH